MIKKNKKTKKRTATRTVKRTVKRINKTKDIQNLKSGRTIEAINNENDCVLKNQNDNYRIKLVKKFGGGKSGDIVYLIQNNNTNYVLKVFMDKKSGDHEIKLHKKHCEIFGKKFLVPYLFSEGMIKNIPFLKKDENKKEYRYAIMESINDPTELSDYIRSNCKKLKNKDINPYNLALQIFYYLAKLSKNNISHCDLHTKNILIIKHKTNLIMDFTFIQPNKKINVGKYHIKIIDFGLSEINKPCPKNRRFIGAVLKDMQKCKLFKMSDVGDIKKDANKIISGLLKKKNKNEKYINEDLYIFGKILRLLNKIKIDKNNLTTFKTKFIEELIRNKKDMKQIFTALTL